MLLKVAGARGDLSSRCSRGDIWRSQRPVQLGARHSPEFYSVVAERFDAHIRMESARDRIGRGRSAAALAEHAEARPRRSAW